MGKNPIVATCSKKTLLVERLLAVVATMGNEFPISQRLPLLRHEQAPVSPVLP